MLFFLFFPFVRLVERMVMTHAAVAPHNPGFFGFGYRGRTAGKTVHRDGRKRSFKVA